MMTLTLTQGNHKVTDDLGWGQGRSRQNTRYPPNSVGWGARLGCEAGDFAGRGSWGLASRADTVGRNDGRSPQLIRYLHIQSAVEKRSLDLNSGFFVEEQVSNKKNALGSNSTLQSIS